MSYGDGGVGHVIFNLLLGVGHSVSCEMEGVGYVFSNHHILKFPGPPLPCFFFTSPLNTIVFPIPLDQIFTDLHTKMFLDMRLAFREAVSCIAKVG